MVPKDKLSKWFLALSFYLKMLKYEISFFVAIISRISKQSSIPRTKFLSTPHKNDALGEKIIFRKKYWIWKIIEFFNQALFSNEHMYFWFGMWRKYKRTEKPMISTTKSSLYQFNFRWHNIQRRLWWPFLLISPHFFLEINGVIHHINFQCIRKTLNYFSISFKPKQIRSCTVRCGSTSHIR